MSLWVTTTLCGKHGIFQPMVTTTQQDKSGCESTRSSGRSDDMCTTITGTSGQPSGIWMGKDRIRQYRD